jgi:lipopolysaccharide export system permease protein
MKRLDSYILQSFIGPFLASFSTTLVVLVIQFLSRYQEDILGKGFSAGVLAELFFYASASLMLLALPMGLLMAGLMTMGNLGERLELTALQSAGVPFSRVLAPLLYFGVLAMLFSAALSWYLIPRANLRLYTLLYDMERAKPALALKPGFFNRWIEGYAIRIGRVQKDQKTIEDVLIYAYHPDGSVARTITAPLGEFFVDKTWLFLTLRLYAGCQYETYQESQRPPTWVQACFDTMTLRLDISGLGLRRSDEKLFAGHQYMLDIQALREAIDSLRHLRDQTYDEYYANLLRWLPAPWAGPGDTTSPQPTQALRIQAENLLRRDKSLMEYYRERLRQLDETVWRYELEWHYKFAIPLAAVIFLLLGATLGGVIRRGGLGVPLVFSTAFFIVFYILNAQGKKLAREGILSPFVGAYLPLFVIGPIVVYLILLVTTEARWLYLDYWKKKWRRGI